MTRTSFPAFRSATLLVLAALISASLLVRAEDTRQNVLLICIDDLRPELASFGADYIRSPHIDRLAATGRPFHRHYVQAPTCGASRYALLTGRYGPPGNDALFQRAQRIEDEPDSVPPSMPEWFRKHGYTTISVGKVSHHPGGRGGDDWDDSTTQEMPRSWDHHLLPAGPWQHPRGAMHGLASGEIRGDPRKMDVLQSVAVPDSAYPDGLIVDEALFRLTRLAADRVEHGKPFFLATGIIRPHLPFGAPARYMTPYLECPLPPTPHPAKPTGRTTWHRSGEFMKYHRWKRDPNSDPEFALQVRRHYAACVSYADAQVGRLMRRLEALRLEENTIVVLWGDHGWHLGEHAIWGKHSLFEESLRSPLILVHAGLPRPGIPSQAVVESIDIYPTLCDLAGLDRPAFLQGTSLLPMLASPEAPGHAAVGYTGNARTIRTATHRLVRHDDGFLELYDHTTPEAETKNLAESDPGRVEELSEWLNRRLNL